MQEMLSDQNGVSVQYLQAALYHTIAMQLMIASAPLDPTSATLRWEQLWENDIMLDFQQSANLFDDADPIIDYEGLGLSWNNMQEWADISLNPSFEEFIAPQDIEKETAAAGGVRFCCFGMVSSS